MTLNSLSMGGTLRSLSGGDGHAEALVEDWPDGELLSFLPLHRDGSDKIRNTYGPIMQHLDLSHAWQRQDDVLRITIERRGGQ